MTTEPFRVEFHLGPYPRLVGVVCGAVQFQALQAGFKSETGEAIAHASEDVCREALAQLSTADDGVDVILEAFADRMEVSILHRREPAPVVGLERFTSSKAFPAGLGGINGLELLSRVDRVLYNTEKDQSQTTLVIFLKPRN